MNLNLINSIKIIIANFSYLLILLFPICLITGPALTDISISILGLIYLIFCFINKDWSDFKLPLVQTILFFCFYCILRSAFSTNPLLSLESSLFYFRFVLFSLSIKFFIIKNKKILNYSGIILFATLTFVTFDAYIQYFFGTNLFNMHSKEYLGRVSGLFGDEFILGSFLSRLLPLLFFFLSLRKNLNPKYFILAMLLVIFIDVLIYISGERTSFFYLFLGTLSIVLLTNRFKTIRFIAFIVSIFIIFFITFTQPHVKERMVSTTLKQIGYKDSIQDSKFNFFSPKHHSHYKSAFRIFNDNILFGQGPKLFRELCKKEKYYPEGCSTHPHNTYIQLLAETGIIGTLFVIILFLVLIFKLIKQFLFSINLYTKKQLSDPKICLFTCFLISLWPFVPTGNFFTNWTSGIIYFSLGFYFAYQKIN